MLETYSSFLALPTLYLEDIFVLSEYRGHGAGAALFRATVAEAERRGCGRMEWAVLDWNRPGTGFSMPAFGAEHLSDWLTLRLRREQFAAILER